MADIEDVAARRGDFSLSEEQLALRGAFRAFFDRNCPPERVRRAEPLGWDRALWAELGELRPVALGVPASRGGDGAGLVELALAAEEAGRRAAPLPLAETAVAARLLAGIDADGASEALDRLLAGDVASVAIGPDPAAPDRRIVPAGPVVTTVLGLRAETLVMCSRDEPPPARSLPCAPLTWWRLADGVALASGDRARSLFAQAQREWRVLTAASLVGVADVAQDLAVQYGQDRSAFGGPVGSRQALAHPLAGVAAGIEGARRLAYQAARVCDDEPDSIGSLASMAFVQAAEAAERAGTAAMHTQGGFGHTLESDVQLFFRRAKRWALVAGDRRRELQRIADALFGPLPRTSEAGW